jgi:hypothetical protein
MSVMMIKKKNRVCNIIPTRIKVTGFNNSGSQILDDEGKTLDSGCRCIKDTRSNNDVDWYSLDNEEAVE